MRKYQCLSHNDNNNHILLRKWNMTIKIARDKNEGMEDLHTDLLANAVVIGNFIKVPKYTIKLHANERVS